MGLQVYRLAYGSLVHNSYNSLALFTLNNFIEVVSLLPSVDDFVAEFFYDTIIKIVKFQSFTLCDHSFLTGLQLPLFCLALGHVDYNGLLFLLHISSVISRYFINSCMF